MGFLYHIATGEVTTLLPAVPPSVGTCTVTGINSSNVVCGTRTIQASPHRTSAFIWSFKTGFKDLGLIDNFSTTGADLNDAGAVAGTMGAGNSKRPFIWQNSRIQNLGSLFGLETVANAISNNQLVVGRSHLNQPPTTVRGFRWSAQDGMISIGVLPGHDLSHATGISADGAVLGMSRKLDGTDQRAVVWRDGLLHDLNTKLLSGIWVYLTTGITFQGNGNILAAGFGGVDFGGVGILLRPVWASPADVTGDCTVNVNDLLLVINEWGKGKSIADITQDGIVDVFDLYEVIDNWS